MAVWYVTDKGAMLHHERSCIKALKSIKRWMRMEGLENKSNHLNDDFNGKDTR